jgi:hypothetical protein
MSWDDVSKSDVIAAVAAVASAAFAALSLFFWRRSQGSAVNAEAAKAALMEKANELQERIAAAGEKAADLQKEMAGAQSRMADAQEQTARATETLLVLHS